MTITIKYVNLFTSEGRLLKEIPTSDLPRERPDFISYAGNLFRRVTFSEHYTEVIPYLYEEQPLASEAKPSNSPAAAFGSEGAQQKLDSI